MKTGFIGIGKISSAIVESLSTIPGDITGKGPAMEGLEMYLSPRNEERSKGLSEKYGFVHRMGSNQEVLDHSDVIFIGLRPAIAVEVLKTLHFEARHTVVSLVPLLRYAPLSEAVFPAGEICRAIPLPSVLQHNCPIPLFRAPETVFGLFRVIGQPLPVADEQQLHAIWTLTGLITPFYDLLEMLSEWTVTHGVDRITANTYLADLFQSLSYMAQHSSPIDYKELAGHAATPNGMNEQAGKEIRTKRTHEAWQEAAERLLLRFG